MSELVRTVAFGDLESGLWGDVWVPAGGGAAGIGYVGAAGDDDGAHAAIVLEGDGADEPWQLDALQRTLTAEPLSDPAPAPDGGFAQLVRVSGGGIETVGCRTAAAQPGPPDKLDSVRTVAAWLGDADGFMLTAARRRRAKGHQQDLLSAALFESGEALRVPDPRLSSTYWDDGRPARAGVELWLTEPEEEVEDERLQIPRRAAGEALGPAAVSELPEQGLTLRSAFFRWHQRGREGAGIYRLLARAT